MFTAKAAVIALDESFAVAERAYDKIAPPTIALRTSSASSGALIPECKLFKR